MAPRRPLQDQNAPWVVLASFLVLTALAAGYVWQSSQAADRSAFEQEARATLDDIRFRIDTYVNVLRAAGGLFAAGENVTRDQFRAYVQALDVQRRHPGIQGIGLSLRIRPQHVAAVTSDLRLNDFPDFRVWPEGAREEHHAIVLIEPLDRRNRTAIGYDMFTNPVRREAMTRAQDTGEAAASAPVRLVQELERGDQQRGFLIYVPVYTSRGVPGTVAERRERLYGFVYAPFRADDLFRAIFDERSPGVALSVADGENQLYESRRLPPDSPLYEMTEPLDVAGREWSVHIVSPRLKAGGSVAVTLATVLGGVVISLLLFALLRMQLLARGRAEEVADALRESEAELQAANRAKDEFLATLSHEMRTPMTAILGWSKLLGENLDDESRAAAVDAIQNSSLAQAQLIDDLLDVSRITAGKMKIEPVPLELGPIVSAAAAAIAPAAEAMGVTVNVEVPPATVTVNGDPARLQQIVWNLLSNAVKFTTTGGSVSVGLHAADGEAVLDVTDTGQGIEPAFLPHVFERFRQADSSTTRAYTGLGLGLAIVRHLAELHRGSVAAHSEGAGKGSRFTVRLPLLQASTPMPDPARGDAAEPANVLRGVRVLVVDDEEDVRSFAAAAFQMGGAEVRSAGSVEEALETFREWQPDTVVTDIGMPGRDGFELIRLIRQQSAVPVVALTAYAREEDRVRAEQAGFDAFISKPVDPAELRGAVAAVLSASKISA
ncbi:MAG TPA: CHASE domain-containing protein [Thermoanaerobaculia bacterium]|nr:CHASE domain-containing protein [Thermoanaerobaculia bacterium]